MFITQWSFMFCLFNIPRDFESPDGICELSEKASNLQSQLEIVSQQREEVMTKAETLNGRVEELELQLQEEAQQKQEALERVQTTEQRVAELETQLQTQAQEKLEVVQCFELRVLDLERQLEEMSHNEAEEQVSCLLKRVTARAGPYVLKSISQFIE